MHTPEKLWLHQHFIVEKMVWFFPDLSVMFVHQLQAQTSEKGGWTILTSQNSNTFLWEF